MIIEWKNQTAAVIGGSGFLGRHLIEHLHRLGCRRIVSLSRRGDNTLEELGAEVIRGDIRDPEAVKNACRGASIVFHTAAKAGVWGSYREYYDINVNGTLNVLHACRDFHIRRLVYTSSPSVAYPPNRDIVHADESIRYPERYLAHYPATKAIAERLVMAFEWSELNAVCLRPHLIWGPGDPHLLPRLVSRAAQGRLLRVGDGHNLVDLTYVVNAAAGHIQAAEMLASQPDGFRRIYFLSDNAPVKLWDWIDQLLSRLGLGPLNRSIPYGAARRLGAGAELLWKLLHLPGEPPMTRFVAGQLAFSHYFDITAAQKDFNYAPVVLPEEALERTVAWLKQQNLTGVRR